MTQSVTSERYPYIPISLTIYGISFNSDALVDTGFDGAIILPEELANQIPGEPTSETPFIVGDGVTVYCPVYVGRVRVGSMSDQITVNVAVLGEEVLVGRRIIDRFKVTLDHGERVIVEA